MRIQTLGVGLLVVALAASSAEASASPTVVATKSSTTTARVIKVVDGDTIRTTKGTIRLIGIDTPETGRCNASAATRNARRLAPVGSVVKLAFPAGENSRDKYGRKLRYVSRHGIDLGGAQIKAGLADARYDSRDGYPWHPKQSDYRRWDARYKDRPCASGGGSSSSDTYTGCRAYGPNGTSTDSQGRRYTKIDCDTKQPL